MNEVKVARLQSEFCTKVYFFELRILLRKMLRPDIFEPLFCGSEKSRKIPAKFPTKKKKIHRRASAGAQAEKEGQKKPSQPARGRRKVNGGH